MSPRATTAAAARTATSARSRCIARRSSSACLATARLVVGADGFPIGDARPEELAFALGLRQARLGGPCLEPGELRAAKEEARVAGSLLPLGGPRRQPVVRADVVPCGVDPVAEELPFDDQRLVRDLDGRGARARVAVEQQQPRGPEPLDALRRAVPVDVELGEGGRSPSGDPLLSHRDELEEHLPRCHAAGLRQARVHLAGPRVERAGHTADGSVRRARQGGSIASIEQLRQGVLEERQRTRLIEDVHDDLHEQPRLERDADAGSRRGNRPLDLLRCERRNGDHAVLQQPREGKMAQRPVVEVSPKRDHQPEAAPWVGDRAFEKRQNLRLPLLVLGQCEQLLELVDHEDELRAPGRKDALDRAAKPALVARELLHQACRRVHGDPEERCFELLERVLAGAQLDDRPCGRAGEGALSQERDEARSNKRGLPAAARPDNGHEAIGADTVDELPAQPLAPEEVARIRLAERAESLVGIPGRTRLSRGQILAGRRVQGAILPKHQARELAQGGGHLDAELVAEDLARLVEHRERLCLPARAVQRQHQVGAQLFP